MHVSSRSGEASRELLYSVYLYLYLKSSPINSTNYNVLYVQNGDRIVNI